VRDVTYECVDSAPARGLHHGGTEVDANPPGTADFQEPLQPPAIAAAEVENGPAFVRAGPLEDDLIDGLCILPPADQFALVDGSQGVVEFLSGEDLPVLIRH